jgi:hypothetical protein
MAIDMGALKRTAEGDPNARVEVNKRWLTEVHRLLEEGEQAKRDLARAGRSNDIFEALFRGPQRHYAPQ